MNKELCIKVGKLNNSKYWNVCRQETWENLAPKRRGIRAKYEVGYFAIVLLITCDWYDKKMETETDWTRRWHGQMKNTLKIYFGMAEERDSVNNQDLV